MKKVFINLTLRKDNSSMGSIDVSELSSKKIAELYVYLITNLSKTVYTTVNGEDISVIFDKEENKVENYLW